ncbi:MAG: hypothetical protein ACP5NY_00245 [Thermocladium sp.]
MCDKYWELRQNIEVTCGPRSLLARLRGDSSESDLAIYWREASGDVFKVALPGFSARAVLLGGLPHISPEDIVLSLPLNENYLGPLIRFLPPVDWDWIIMQAQRMGKKYVAQLMGLKSMKIKEL